MKCLGGHHELLVGWACRMSCIITIRLRVSENQVPRKIFGPKKDEVTGD